MEYEITNEANLLEDKLNDATAADRIKLQPKVQKMVDSIVARGHKVPLSLSRINAELIDEVYDDMFDNMPL